MPIYGKIFERSIFNSLFEYLEKYKLLSAVNLVFEQMISVQNLESRGVFLYMSDAFDKVWHEGLIFKLKSMDISDVFRSYWKFLRKQISKSCFTWSDIRLVTS